MSGEAAARAGVMVTTGCLSVFAMLGACQELKGSSPQAHCTKAYEKCVLPTGVLGVCDSVECKGDAIAPCLVCRSQH